MRWLLKIMLCVFLSGVAGQVYAADKTDEFSVGRWSTLETQAAANNPRAQGLTKGYLAGVRDALRFYTRVGQTFRLCWPKDHKVDDDLIRNVVNAVVKEHPDMAKPDDNFAYLIILSLYNVYPCR
jgi:hypothetical protein